MANKKDYPLKMRVLNKIGGVAFYLIPTGLILRVFFEWGTKVSIVALIIFITALFDFMILKNSFDKEEEDKQNANE